MSYSYEKQQKKAQNQAEAVARQQKQDRERIRKLIITLGDENKKVIAQVRGLAMALEFDVELHGDLIAETVVECARHIPVKTTMYAAFLGKMVEKKAAWVSKVVGQAFKSFQTALKAGEVRPAQLLLQFIVGLGNYGVLGLTSVMNLLSEVASLSQNSKPAKGGDYGLFLALSGALYISPAARNKVAHRIEELIATADEYIPTRNAAWKPLLRICKGEELPDRLEAVLVAVKSMQLSDWTSQAVRHIPSFEPKMEGREDIAALPSLDFGPEAFKKSRIRFQVPLAASRFLSSTLEGDGADSHLPEHDRWLLEDHIILLLDSFGTAAEECAKQLLRIPVVHPDFEAILIETVFAQMLRLPSPTELPLFYCRLLEFLVQKQASLRGVVDRAFQQLIKSADKLDNDALEVLADSHAYHLINHRYQFQWSLFEGASATEASLRYLRRTFERLVRLSFQENVHNNVPESLHVYVPPDCQPSLPTALQGKEEYQKFCSLIKIKEPDTAALVAYCEQLQRKRTSSPPPEEQGDAKRRKIDENGQAAEGEKEAKDVKEDNSNTDDKDKNGEDAPSGWMLESVFEVLILATLQAAKTNTHMHKFLKGHAQALRSMLPEDEEGALSVGRTIVRCVFAYWALFSKRLELTIEAFLDAGIIGPREVLEEALDPEAGRLQGCDSVAVCNILDMIAQKSVEMSETARVGLAMAKTLGKQDSVEEWRQKLDIAVREDIELFTIIFTAFLRNYQYFEGKDAFLQQVMQQRLVAVGRKYSRFIKPLLEAAEHRIQGLSDCPPIMKTVESLKSL